MHTNLFITAAEHPSAALIVTLALIVGALLAIFGNGYTARMAR